MIPAVERAGAAGPGGPGSPGSPGSTAGWTYHARVNGLRPGATYGYAVTADNDSNAADPFSATFTTAPEGRAKFRFTSFGDLVPPGAGEAVLAAQSALAVGAVETFQPLFHLLNGDLTGTGVIPPEAGRDLGNQVQMSAAYRPWLPVPGGYHRHGGGGRPAGQPDQGASPFPARYLPPPPGADGPDRRWYAFRIGTALFVTLSGDDVAYQGAGARGYSGGAQTRWLEATLAAARGDPSVDWIVVQMHQCACSSGTDARVTGSDLRLRREWLPLFDSYEVDLVLSGHGGGYERSFPVRGLDPGAGADAVTGAAADTGRPHPVTTVDSGVFDTSQGTVHLVLGGGAADSGTAPGDEAAEVATWSARRDNAAGPGIAVFDVNPGTEAGGQTSIIVRYYQAAGPDLLAAAGEDDGDYLLFEAFTLVRPRSDGRRWHLRG